RPDDAAELVVNVHADRFGIWTVLFVRHGGHGRRQRLDPRGVGLVVGRITVSRRAVRGAVVFYVVLDKERCFDVPLKRDVVDRGQRVGTARFTDSRKGRGFTFGDGRLMRPTGDATGAARRGIGRVVIGRQVEQAVVVIEIVRRTVVPDQIVQRGAVIM